MSASDKLLTTEVSLGMEMEYEKVCKDVMFATYCQHVPRPKHILNFSRDGSLRPRQESTEIKFRNPLQGTVAMRGMEEIAMLYEKLTPSISWRCGMHVHVDCRGLYTGDMYKVLVLAAATEHLLYAWDNTGRQENKFCQPVSDSVGAYAKDGQVRLTKYAAINVASLYGFGSIEFRFAEATGSLQRMIDFTNIALGYRRLAQAFETSTEVVRSILKVGNMASWFTRYAHPLLADQVVPVINATGQTLPSLKGMSAAIRLAQKESNIEQRLIT